MIVTPRIIVYICCNLLNVELDMNLRQANTLQVSVGLLFMTLLYPPYQIMGRSLGYGWIFSPPHQYAIIDQGQMMVQWMALAIITGILFKFLGGENGKETTGIKLPIVSKRLFPPLILLLRILRGGIGFIGGWQLIGLLPMLSWFSAGEGVDWGKGAAIVLVKLIAAIVCFGLFMGMRVVINRLNFIQNGTSHPSLTKRWSI